MCGIFGALTPLPAPARARVDAALLHRGPDEGGAYAAGDVVLLHRRLKIIDLSAAGAQPMANEDGAVQVVFNGEIYNHHDLRRELRAAGHEFRGRADTEVIVHGYEQWGDDVVLRLEIGRAHV
jgi:asparagine synthase (glutamine-hydrolysing)